MNKIKTLFHTSVQDVLKHRQVLILLIVMIVLAVIAIIFVATSIQPSELRIVTHYTAYGQTHFYRNEWYYMLTFLVFFVLTAVFGILMTLKFLRLEKISLAKLFVSITIFIILFCLITYIHLAEFS